jgi:hypothetical protein
MLAVEVSYRQTIRAYPQVGGSYIVATQNLGRVPGLIAAAGLPIDYVMTVAVSIACVIQGDLARGSAYCVPPRHAQFSTRAAKRRLLRRESRWECSTARWPSLPAARVGRAGPTR